MKRITFGNYAGVRVKGEAHTKLDLDENKIITPIEKALWLTAMVESNGLYGSVMNYDGTGMTAGIHQAVAVYPRNLKVQGSLWGLLNTIRTIVNTHIKADNTRYSLSELEEIFTAHNAIFTLDGVIRNKLNGGKPLNGFAIRKILTGDTYGVMPATGKRRTEVERIAYLFHDIFSSPITYVAQNEFGVQHFSKIAERALRFSKKFKTLTINDFIYKRLYKCESFIIASSVAPIELDLAMSMFWSHSVNAPGQALKIFCNAADLVTSDLKKDPKGYAFARNLVKKLGTSRYGRWDDNLKNGRYQRTRRYAMKIFNPGLFLDKNALMPEKF